MEIPTSLNLKELDHFLAIFLAFTILRPPGCKTLPGEKSLAVILGKFASLKLFELLLLELLGPSRLFEELANTPFSVSKEEEIWSVPENTGKEAAPA